MGLIGIAYANNLSNIFSLIAIIYAMNKMNVLPKYAYFNRNNLFKNYLPYCKHVFPIALPMVIDVLCFEINSILIGIFKNDSYFGAHVIMCNIVSIFYAFPQGICATMCTLISNAIGQNKF